MDFEAEYLDATQAAERLRIHPESVKRLIRQGQLPGRKFGNKWFITRTELDQFASWYWPRPGRPRKLL